MESKDLRKQERPGELDDLLDLDEFPEEEGLPGVSGELDEPEEDASEASDLAFEPELPEFEADALEDEDPGIKLDEEEPNLDAGESDTGEPESHGRMVGWVYRKQPGKPAEVTVVEAMPEEAETSGETESYELPPDPDEEDAEPQETPEEDILAEEAEPDSEDTEDGEEPPEPQPKEKKAKTKRKKPIRRSEQSESDEESSDVPETESFTTEPEDGEEEVRPGRLSLLIAGLRRRVAQRRQEKKAEAQAAEPKQPKLTLVPDKEEPWGEEQTGGLPFRRRAPKKRLPPLADLEPKQLATIYGNGLSRRKSRLIAAAAVCLVMCYVNLADGLNLPLFTLLWQGHWAAAVLLELLGLVCLLLLPVLSGGFKDLIKGAPGFHSLASLSVLLTAADTLLYAVGMREGPMPGTAVAAVLLMVTAWGEYLDLTARRLSCRAASMSSHPVRVARGWENGAPSDQLLAYDGDNSKFGSQMQEEDGVRRGLRPLNITVLIAVAVLTVLSCLGQKRAELALWNASVMMMAACPLAGTLTYGMAFRRIAKKLNRCNGALAGWDGVESLGGGDTLLVKDGDLFPTGMIDCTGIKQYAHINTATVVSYAATLIHAAQCGLEKTFADLLYAQKCEYLTDEMEEFQVHEGGYSARIRQDEVLVGTASFMAMMDIPLPKGVIVKTATFCAINNQLAGQFTLVYKMPRYVMSSMDTVLRNKLKPVMALRDFNVTEGLLRNAYGLPMNKVEFPDLDMRTELSDLREPEEAPLGAILCREGLDAHCDAVVGARRLCRATRSNRVWLAVSSVLGLLLSFYLTWAQAFTALQAGNLLVFLILWMVPPVLNAWQVDRY